VEGRRSIVRSVPLLKQDSLLPRTDIHTTPGLAYEYYEHPDFRGEGWSLMKPVRAGVNPRITLEPCQTKNAGFGIKYRGYIDVPAEGLYTFWLRCSPRGELFIGDDHRWVLESQSRRRENSNRIALKAGRHPIEFRIFYRSDVDRTLEIDYAGPGIDRLPIPAGVLSH
jgi:hypothetical protein